MLLWRLCAFGASHRCRDLLTYEFLQITLLSVLCTGQQLTELMKSHGACHVAHEEIEAQLATISLQVGNRYIPITILPTSRYRLQLYCMLF